LAYNSYCTVLTKNRKKINDKRKRKRDVEKSIMHKNGCLLVKSTGETMFMGWAGSYFYY
jgi:hypothetical protein